MWIIMKSKELFSLKNKEKKKIKPSRKHAYIILTPDKPNFYIVKLGFTRVNIIFHIFAQNIDCGYLLELPHWGGSNEYQQSMFWAEIWKISKFFCLKNFSFWRWNFLYIWIGVFSKWLECHPLQNFAWCLKSLCSVKVCDILKPFHKLFSLFLNI